MKITIWSALGGKLSGHIVMNVPGTHTVRKLLDVYCSKKGVHSAGYVMRSRDNLLLNPNKTLDQANIDDGETLTIGLSDDEEQTFAFGSWWMVTFAALFIGTVGLATATFLYMKPPSYPTEYGIVMDAGSSHSEIYVYKWNGEKPLDTADITLVNRCFMAGGISSFVENVEGLSEYLDNCMKETKSNVPVPSQSMTPFYIGATAGMRILRDFDSEGALLILSTIREYLLTKTKFLVDHNNIEIIDGAVEGASGWTAVNSLLGHLKKDTEHTVSALDVGGASFQITRIVYDESWDPQILTLYRNNFPVLSQSFLCYGIGEAQHRYEYFLVKMNNTKEEGDFLVNPCLARGVLSNVTSDDISGPCTLNDDSLPVLNVNKINIHKLQKMFKNFKLGSTAIKVPDIVTTASPTEEDPVENWPTYGSGNATMCEEYMKRLFDVGLCESTFTYGSCMNSENVPVIEGDLVAFSSLFQQMMLALDLKSGTPLPEFKKIVFEVCSLTAEDLYQRYPGHQEQVVDLCFDAMYVYNLLTVGLGIGDSEFRKIKFTDEIDSTDVEWPMGFMMNKTTSFPADTPKKDVDSSVFGLLVVLFAAFLISGLMFCFHAFKIKKQSTSYQRNIADHIDQELHKFI